MYRKIFLDANVIVDIYDENRKYHEYSSKAISLLLQQKDTELFTSCDIVTTLYYVLSKVDKNMALESILNINNLCNIVEFSNTEIAKSCQLMQNDKKFTDLEDTIQYIIAKKAGCDLILSNDKKFTSTQITLLSSKKFLNLNS